MYSDLDPIDMAKWQSLITDHAPGLSIDAIMPSLLCLMRIGKCELTADQIETLRQANAAIIAELKSNRWRDVLNCLNVLSSLPLPPRLLFPAPLSFLFIFCALSIFFTLSLFFLCNISNLLSL
jgi:hypothetical protein